MLGLQTLATEPGESLFGLGAEYQFTSYRDSNLFASYPQKIPLENRFSLYSLGWPGAHHTEQTDLELLLSSAASGSLNAEISGMYHPTPSWFSSFHLCTYNSGTLRHEFHVDQWGMKCIKEGTVSITP